MKEGGGGVRGAEDRFWGFQWVSNLKRSVWLVRVVTGRIICVALAFESVVPAVAEPTELNPIRAPSG